MKNKSFVAALAALAMNAALWGQTITVTSPAAGSEWAQGSTKTITWISSGVTGNVKIKLRSADPANPVSIPDIASNTANNGSFSWHIPADLAPGAYKVRVRTAANDPVIYGDSGTFTIVPNNQAACPNANLKWSSELTVSPEAPKVDQVVTFTAKFLVEKCDFAKVAACFYLRLDGSSNKNLIEKREFTNLAQGTQVPVTFQWRAFRKGKHRVSLVLEETRPREMKTDDNTASTEFDVYAPPVDPCSEHADDPADLKVTYFDVTTPQKGNYNFHARVKNDGPRCVKAVRFCVKTGSHILWETNKVAPAPDGYLLIPGQEIEFEGNFSDDNPVGGPCQLNQWCAKFDFIIDPNNLIPDPDRANNTKSCIIVVLK